MQTRTSLIVSAIVVAAAASGCASKGYQRAEHLADKIHDTRAAVDAHGCSRQAAFDSMTALAAEPLENLPAKFETFDASVDDVVSADGALRGALEAMKASAHKRFKNWGEENVSYDDADMQVRSQKSRAEATEIFRRAVDDTDIMLARSAGFVTYLSDLRKILSNDLTSSGVSGVTEYAARARASNEEIDELARLTRASLGAVSDAMNSKSTGK